MPGIESIEGASSPGQPWESLFPIDIEQVSAVQHRLLQVSENDLRSFISVREDGAPDDPVTIVYGAGFASWHKEHQDFESDKAVQMYQIGTFYGSHIALDRYHKLTGQRLIADDSDAYSAAKATVIDSYRGLDGDSQWQTDYKREQRYTGGTTLALLNAVMHDRTLNQFNRIYEGKIPKDEALESFYTGLLDAAIFMNTYASYRDLNRLPPTFDSFIDDEDPSLPPVYHLANEDIVGSYPSNVEVELDPSDVLIKEFIQKLVIDDAETKTVLTVLAGQRRVLAFNTLMKQSGPNTFQFSHQLRGIYDVTNYPTRRQLLRRVGAVAAGGTAAMNIADIWAPPISTPVLIGTSAAGAVLFGGATAVLNRRPHTFNLVPVWLAPGFQPHSYDGTASLQK